MRTSSIVIALVTIFWSADADARSFRLNQVPNGAQFGCSLCHENAQGGGPRNGFGSQVENTLEEPKETADVKWDVIFDQDGDADRYSNGLELGDPEGTWTIGDPDPEGPVYGPHDRTDNPCGDGELLNPPEECDGDDLNGMTCEDLGWGPGTLSCNSVCRFNESECEGWEPPNGFPGNNQTNNTTNQGDTNAGTNGATNGTTNNDTNGTTNSETSGPPDGDDIEPSGCCATIAEKSSPEPIALPLFATMLLVALRRRRRRRPRHQSSEQGTQCAIAW